MNCWEQTDNLIGSMVKKPFKQMKDCCHCCICIRVDTDTIRPKTAQYHTSANPNLDNTILNSMELSLIMSCDQNKENIVFHLFWGKKIIIKYD